MKGIIMGRSTRYIHLDKSKEYVESIIRDYLTKNSFSLVDWKGEPVYRAGEPLALGYHYLKWSYSNGILQLEAWIGGLSNKEYHIDNGFGAAPTIQSAPYKISLQHLISQLEQPLPSEALVYANPYIPPDTQSDTQTNISPDAQVNMQQDMQAGMQNNAPTPVNTPIQTTNNDNTAVVSLVFGVLSIVSSGVFFISVALALIGLALASGKKAPDQASIARAGKILCIIGLCVSPILFLLEIAYIIFQ